MSHMTEPDQFAWLSAPGLAALSVVHLRGPRALAFLKARGLTKALETRPRHVWLKSKSGEALDEVMMAREYGGFRLTCHGGEAVRGAIEEELRGEGFTPVDPHELPVFGATSRYRRELLRVLPVAQSDQAVRFVLWALQKGETLLSRALDAPVGLLDLVNRSESMRYLFEPFRVHLWGPANAGKSSLLNALCGKKLAEVGAEPGLTRDMIEGRFEHEGFTLCVYDTPGEISGGSELELLAFAQARAQFDAHGDMVLYLVPPGHEPPRIAGAAYVYSRADEAPPRDLPANGLPCAVSVLEVGSLMRLKHELVALQKPGVSPELNDAFALSPDLRADLAAFARGELDAATLRSKWL